MISQVGLEGYYIGNDLEGNEAAYFLCSGELIDLDKSGRERYQSIKYLLIFDKYNENVPLVLLDTLIAGDVAAMYKEQLDKDIKAMEEGKQVSLLAKWLPSSNTSSAIKDNTSLKDKLEIMFSHCEVANNNIEAVFDLILEMAKSKEVPREELPKQVLIISDMEFDAATASGYYYSNECTCLSVMRMVRH